MYALAMQIVADNANCDIDFFERIMIVLSDASSISDVESDSLLSLISEDDCAPMFAVCAWKE